MVLFLILLPFPTDSFLGVGSASCLGDSQAVRSKRASLHVGAWVAHRSEHAPGQRLGSFAPSSQVGVRSGPAKGRQLLRTVPLLVGRVPT